MQIILDRVSFAYGRRLVLREVSWRIRPGVCGLLGPNGAGKTTLINLLVGLTTPKGGRIRLEPGVGDSNSAGPPRVSVGFLPQRFTLAGEMRVLDTVAYAAWNNGLPVRDCRHAATQALAIVQLSDYRLARVRTLSGGQRQRVGLAAALTHAPPVLVLDEPTVGLDPGQRLRFREIVAEIGQTRTVLLSTHLAEDIAHLCHTVGVLAGGRMAFDGPTDDLIGMISDARPDGLLGSTFERGYHSLIEQLGVASD